MNLIFLWIFLISAAFLFQNCGEFHPTTVGGNRTEGGLGTGALSSQYVTASSLGPGYDIILIGGQSNAVGYGCGPHTDVLTARENTTLG